MAGGEDRDRLRSLLGQILDLPAPERARRIAEVLRQDPALGGHLRALLLDAEGAVAGPRGESLFAAQPAEETGPAFVPGALVAERYRIAHLLGCGGMGEVYEAEDLALHVRVALKTLRLRGTGDEWALVRFRREVLLARSITHANVCRIYDLGIGTGPSGPLPFLTMELLAGESLAERIRACGRLGPADALPILRQVTAGLAAAHAAGVVHRDLKCGNVLLTAGPRGERAVVTDFGLARGAMPCEDGEHSGAGMLLGTPAYMAPEQVSGGDVGPATDIYALGVVVFHMLTGTLPFRGATPLATATLRLVEDAPSLREILPSLDPSWAAVVERCLARRPEQRFARATDVLEALALGDSATLVLPMPVAGLPTVPPPPAMHLPERFTRFIGRERERDEILALLGGRRLVTLAGAAGCGKTRLAVEVARGDAGRHPDGVWLVDLAPVASPDRLVPAVAAALGLAEQPGRDLAKELSARLAPRRMLLLLDNGEHLAGAAGELADGLLRAAPGLTVLVTSREPLGLEAEAVYRVEPLGLPPRAASAPDDLLASEAVLLFVDRARTSQPAFRLTAANAAAVAELTRRLDGIPLALELAAARVKAIPVEQILGRLQDRFRLLTGGGPSMMPHHRTLAAALDWSYEHLDRAEAMLLNRLAVFAGPFSLDAAETVGSAEPIAESEVLDLLTALLDKSLLVYGEEAGEARYRLLESVRAYGAGKLRQAGEEDPARERHLDHFARLSEIARGFLDGPDQLAWLDRLEAAHDDIALGFDFAATSPARAERGLRLAAALGVWWDVRGHTSEGWRQVSHVLAASAGSPPTPARVRALVSAAFLAHRLGDAPAARTLVKESIGLGRRMSDREPLALALHRLAVLEAEAGNLDEARRLSEESLAHFRASGNRIGIARVLVSQGIFAAEHGDLAPSRKLYEEGLAIYRDMGSRRAIANVLNNLGNLAYDDRDFSRARRLHEEALATRREVGDLFGTAASLDNLGNVADVQGDLERARALHEEALAIWRAIGNPHGVIIALTNLGETSRHRGAPGAAHGHYVEALRISLASDDRRGAPGALEGVARVALTLGAPQRAIRLFAAAGALRQALGFLLVPAETQALEAELARLRAELGDELFAAAWAEGESWSFDQAIGDALDPP